VNSRHGTKANGGHLCIRLRPPWQDSNRSHRVFIPPASFAPSRMQVPLTPPTHTQHRRTQVFITPATRTACSQRRSGSSERRPRRCSGGEQEREEVNHKGCTRTRTIHHEHGVKQSTITTAINQIILLVESTHRLHALSDERSTHRAVLLILGERRESTWTRGPKLPPLHGIGTLNQIQSLGQRLKHEHERMHSSNAHAL